MEYNVASVRTVLLRKNLDTEHLDSLQSDLITKSELVSLWFGRLGWSASILVEIINDLEKLNRTENMFGDGI